jgi:hypothetical protein
MAQGDSQIRPQSKKERQNESNHGGGPGLSGGLAIVTLTEIAPILVEAIDTKFRPGTRTQ